MAGWIPRDLWPEGKDHPMRVWIDIDERRYEVYTAPTTESVILQSSRDKGVKKGDVRMVHCGFFRGLLFAHSVDRDANVRWASVEPWTADQHKSVVARLLGLLAV